MTAVTIAGTFKKDSRPDNGLESIADEMIAHQLRRYVVVGIVQFAGGSVPGPGEALTPRVRFLAIEPLDGDAADQGRQMLDQARKQRGLDLVSATLFDEAPADGNKPAGWVDERTERSNEVDGQQALVDEPPDDNDPTAGPWPGDADYQPPDREGGDQ